MNVTFYGATREVTGSMHLVGTNHDRILLDCGMFQGKRKEARLKNLSFAFDPALVTNMVLSHAHIDHSGRIPLFVKNGFNGRIVCTNASQDASRCLLQDSAHIQESDAAYLNYKSVKTLLADINLTNKDKRQVRAMLKKNGHRLDLETLDTLINRYRLEKVEPLYTQKETEASLSQFDGQPYRQPVEIGNNITCTLYDAGHILGSAITIVRFKTNDKQFTVGYTGDLGRFGKPIIQDPTVNFAEEDRAIDLLIMESTYGNRLHDPVRNLKKELAAVLQRAVARGGAILIPAFSYGRTQEMLYLLHELYNSGHAPKFPVYVDSPLSSKITKVFGEHPEVYDRATHQTFLEQGKNPFSFARLTYVETLEESMALNRDRTPHIVIASSGMCEAGRILHHLRHKIHNPQTTILIVGFMAEHTLGRRILEKGTRYQENGRREPVPMQKILGKEYPMRAHVETMNGFSAHADQSELLRFLKTSNLTVKRIAVVHGEEEQSLAFAKTLQGQGFNAFVPLVGETVRV